MRERKRTELVLKFQISLCQANLFSSIWKLKDQICCQDKYITTPSTCTNTTGPYVHFLYEEVILCIDIYVQVFFQPSRKNIPLPQLWPLRQI